MGLRVKTNTESLIAQRRIGDSRKELGDSLEKLSSGLRINKSADDAAGLAVSERIRSTTHSLGVAKRNATALAQVEAGKVIRIEKGQLVLAVYNLDGEYFVTDDACTHGPGSLSEGCIEGDLIECDFHNGAFNIRTGAVATAPCMIPVKTYPVVISDDGTVSIEA